MNPNASVAAGCQAVPRDPAIYAIRVAAAIPLDLARAVALAHEVLGSASAGAQDFGLAVLAKLNARGLQRLMATPQGSELLDLLRSANA